MIVTNNNISLSRIERNSTMDMMKGVAIIFVIIGHVASNEYIHRFIYLWHMPLFFILSGYFFKADGFKSNIIRGVRTLILPYLAWCFIIVLLSIIEKHFIGIDRPYIVPGAIFGTPRALYQSNLLFSSGYIFALWFLPALFICRLIATFCIKFHLMLKVLMGGVLCWTGMCLAEKYGHYPICIFQAMCSLPFFLIGIIIRDFNLFEVVKRSKLMILTCIIFFILSIFFGDISLSACVMRYPLLSVLGGTSAVLLIYTLIEFTIKSTVVVRLGQISIIILGVHTVDYLLDISLRTNFYICRYSGVLTPLLNNSMNFIMPIGVSLILSKIKFVRWIMNVKLSGKINLKSDIKYFFRLA